MQCKLTDLDKRCNICDFLIKLKKNLEMVLSVWYTVAVLALANATIKGTSALFI